MSVNKTTGRGRGRPPKNRPALDPVIRAAIIEQASKLKKRILVF
jgi:hypothetical protein